MINECEIVAKPANNTTSTTNGDNKTSTNETKSNRGPGSLATNPLGDEQPQEKLYDSEITESSKLLKGSEDALSPKGSNFKIADNQPKRKRSLSTITSNYLPEEISPLLKQKQVQAQPSSFEGLRTYRPKPTLLYATTCGEGGRSASIAISSSQLEPTYPWDYDLDNEDAGDNSSFHSDGFSGMVRGDRRMYGPNDEYQHPSLETRKLKIRYSVFLFISIIY